STDSGATWTKKASGLIVPDTAFDIGVMMKSVPYNGVTDTTGHLFLTANDTNTSYAFQRSTNANGASPTFSSVTNVTGVTAFGFGATAPGQTYPAIYIAGRVSSVYGIWRSIDNCANWTKLDTYPLGIFDKIKGMEGDAVTYGRIYVAFAGCGFAQGNFS